MVPIISLLKDCQSELAIINLMQIHRIVKIILKIEMPIYTQLIVSAFPPLFLSAVFVADWRTGVFDPKFIFMALHSWKLSLRISHRLSKNDPLISS
jgi:hypothetical protein